MGRGRENTRTETFEKASGKMTSGVAQDYISQMDAAHMLANGSVL